MNIGDGVASWIRTVVPGAWAAAVTLLLQWWTGLPTQIADTLNSEMVIGIIVSAVLAIWYGFWRWLEPRLPNWLTTILFGVTRQPTYQTYEARHAIDDPVDGGDA